MSTKLSPRMVEGLKRYANEDMGPDRWAIVFSSNTNTLAALVSRGLINPGTTHALTQKGREEAINLFDQYRAWYFAPEQVKRRLEQDCDTEE